MALNIHFPLIFFTLLCLVTACGGDNDNDSSTGGNQSNADNSNQPVVPTTANIDRHCDEASYPSLEWLQCEAENFALANGAAIDVLQPAFQLRLLTQQFTEGQFFLERALNDPSWLLIPSGNTPLTPYCSTNAGGPCVGDPFRYPEADGRDGSGFYTEEAEVTPVLFYDRGCARIAGRVWRPLQADGKLPYVVVQTGSGGAPEQLYWFAVQPLVRQGFAVLTFDTRGQGRSDFMTPTGEQGSNQNSKVFWEGLVDAIDFMHSSAARPHPHNDNCADSYPTEMDAFNPIAGQLDYGRLGIAGHSLGAIGVSVVQGYGAPGAAPWPGLMDAENPVKAAVAWDSLIAPDGIGFAPDENFLPQELVPIFSMITRGSPLPDFGPGAPTLSFSADYGLVPLIHLTPPDPEAHNHALRFWQNADVPIYSISIRGSTHFDFSPTFPLPSSSFCADSSSGYCEGGWAVPMIAHYTTAWMDRWLKQPGEKGYNDADSRLLDDGGPLGAERMSFHFRSTRDFPDRSGHRQHCEDIRAGC